MNKFLLACLVLVSLHLASTSGYELAKLNEIKFLEFRKENKTVGSHPTSQIICSDERRRHLCNLFGPTYIRCENVSYPSKVVAWECKADLYDGINFKYYNVRCDRWPDYNGYENRHVIAGSCRVDIQLRKSYWDDQ